jgi:hypothetical protein
LLDNLGVVLGFLRLQDKHNICSVSNILIWNEFLTQKNKDNRQHFIQFKLVLLSTETKYDYFYFFFDAASY